MDKQKPIIISFTGNNSHSVKIPTGQGSFSIGLVPTLKKMCKLKFFSVSLLSLLIASFSCNTVIKKEPATTANNYVSLILSLDTLNIGQRMQLTDSVLATFPLTDTSLYKKYFTAYHYQLANNRDSALLLYNEMKPDSLQHNWIVLKQYNILQNDISNGNIAPAEQAGKILALVNYAEKHSSAFTYRLYDLLAKTYYINHNAAKAKEYAQLYYNNNPFRSNTITRQRYFDLSFLLASRLGDTLAMQQNADSSRLLALQIRDSTALMRSYDYEAQVQSSRGNYGTSTKILAAIFQYHQQKGLLTEVSFNNLATAFLRAGRVDSAIFYYQKGIAWAAKEKPRLNLYAMYSGLQEAYKKKGEYENAYIAQDSAIQINGRNLEAIQFEKIEEIHTRYETEKKDIAITSLQTTNTLHQKIIRQQRWIFAGVALLCAALVFVIYNNYRRRILKEKNEKLKIENKRLLLEQKIRQQQLDPHFIYNAISNLQGLISSDKKEEANAYLIAFSKLMRHSLELNRHDLILLHDEISLLENYIKLQQMRFENKFTYSIDINSDDKDAIMIPPMLLQPFVENAIEHGFKNIDYTGYLAINFTEEKDMLHITIIDNGKGLQPGVEKNTGKKSLSRIITQERLDLLFNKEAKEAWFNIAPNNAPGKGVQVNIFLPTLNA